MVCGMLFSVSSYKQVVWYCDIGVVPSALKTLDCVTLHVTILGLIFCSVNARREFGHYRHFLKINASVD